MKAYVLEGIGRLVLKEIEIPSVPEGWVLVKVKASSICSSDIGRIFVRGTYHFPTIPGHEFSGIVNKIGEGVSKTWLGKKVGVFPLIPCKTCDECNKGNYACCRKYDYIGSRRDGAFAEYVLVPEWNLVELSDDANFDEYALMEPLSVAIHSINLANIQNNDRVAIIGTGAIGFLCALASMEKTEHVDIIGKTDKKKRIAEHFGVNLVLNPDHEYDVVIEAVGDEKTIHQSISLVRPGGTIVLMGNPNGDISLPIDCYWQILRKEIKIRGSWNSVFNHTHYSDWYQAKQFLERDSEKIRMLITHHYNSDQLMKGLMLMKERNEPYCRVVIRWE